VVHCGNGISGHQGAKYPLNRGQNFFLQISQYGYKKIQNFTLISKMLTYFSDKMHPKKVLRQKLFLEKNSS
jgi:hypothetical protein